MLEPDELQEHTHAARRLAAYANVQWQALDEISAGVIPEEVRKAMFLKWWEFMMTPRVEMPPFPDFSKMFREGDDE